LIFVTLGSEDVALIELAQVRIQWRLFLIWQSIFLFHKCTGFLGGLSINYAKIDSIKFPLSTCQVEQHKNAISRNIFITYFEDGDCNVRQDAGTTSTYDTTKPRKMKLHIWHKCEKRGKILIIAMFFFYN
jgi:hypothetical protein